MTKNSVGSIRRLPLSVVARESDQDVALDAEHLAFLGGLGVVEAEEVQDAVRRQQEQLVHERVAGGLRLYLRDLGAQDHVAEKPGG
jgi:hypothetical protein